MSVTKVEDFETFEKEVASVKRKVLVKFEADWCIPCEAMAAVVEDVARRYPEVKVVAVDIDGDGIDSILKEYGVRSLPTFVRVENGAIVRSATGTLTKAELSSLLDDND